MKRRLLILAACFALLLPSPVQAAPGDVNMTQIFPGPHQTRLGWNYVTNSQSNLYYSTDPAAGTLLQANDPTGCHFDTFRWGSTLRYLATTNRCAGNDKVSLFEPGIELAPALWNGSPWTKSGTSRVITLNQGKIECTGLNAWTAQVVGWVEVTPGEQAIYLTNTQYTTWETGPCAPYTTSWVEHMLYTDDGYRRSVGGNVNGGFSWDVWYEPIGN